jgi:hypothetical protein
MLGLPVLHNLLIIFIYRTYYPDRKISTALRILNIVLNIICILDLVLFIYTIATFPVRQYPQDARLEAYINFAITAFLCITTTVQIIGSFRLIKIVKENARLQLEASFA